MGTPHRGSSYAASGKTLGEILNVIMRVSLTDRFAGGVRILLLEDIPSTAPYTGLESFNSEFALLKFYVTFPTGIVTLN